MVAYYCLSAERSRPPFLLNLGEFTEKPALGPELMDGLFSSPFTTAIFCRVCREGV